MTENEKIEQRLLDWLYSDIQEVIDMQPLPEPWEGGRKMTGIEKIYAAVNREAAIENVNKFRKKHRRCRTCSFAKDTMSGFYCIAKEKRRYGKRLDRTRVAGIFCSLYRRKDFEI